MVEIEKASDGAAILPLLVRAGSRKTRVLGEKNGRLLVEVRQKAEGGRANDALIRLLAKTFGLPEDGVKIVDGLRSKRKKVLIRLAPIRITEMLADLTGKESDA